MYVNLENFSWVIRKPIFCICKKKGADQLAYKRLNFCYIDGTISLFLNMKFQASSHFLWLNIPVCVGSGRKLQRTGFLTTQLILFTVGEDGYTRFWCLRQGSLLCTIPPPCPTSRETIPCVQFSMRWGDKMGNSGLIMALEDKLHYYGSLSVT